MRKEARWQLEDKAGGCASSHGPGPVTPPCGSARGSARGTVAERHATKARRAEGGQGTQAKDTQPCLMTLSSIWKTRKAESLAPNCCWLKN